MKRLFVLVLALMAVLSACGKSASPDASPSLPDGSPSLSPSASASSEPSASPGTSAEPDASMSPGGDEDELVRAYRSGALVVDDSGAALNYQAWLDFALPIEAGQDAELEIVLLDAGAGVARRCLARMQGTTASWEDPAGTANPLVAQNARFSVGRGDALGAHTLSLNGETLVGFTYHPMDPAEGARLRGYTPLEELPPFYPWQQALSDGCLVITDSVENVGMLVAFSEMLSFDEGSFLRVCRTTTEGDVILTDILYLDGTVCIRHDNTRDGFAGDSGITSTYYDQCSLELQSEDGMLNLVLHSGQTGEDVVLLSVDE